MLTPEQNIAIADKMSAQRADKLEQEAKQRLINEATTLRVGDILVEQWGYSMCLVNFYKVTALRGKTMVTLQEVCPEIVTSQGGWNGQMKPTNEPVAKKEPLQRRVKRSYDGRPSVKIRDFSHGYLHEAGKTYFFDHCD